MHRTDISSRLAMAIVIVTLLHPLLACEPCSAGQSSPNVILIVIDAMRPDHLGCYGYEYSTSPNIDALAAEAIVFENAIAQVPWTKSSFSSMFTSLYPFQHGVQDWESVLAESLVTLPELLRDNGYSTIAVVNIMAVAGRFHVLQGFDAVSPAPKNKRNAEATTEDALSLIKKSREPFFILIHYFDPHEPYSAPARCVEKVHPETDMASVRPRLREHEYGNRPSEEYKHEDIILYDACIRFVDDHLERLFAFLRETGIRDGTLLILTADHGEAFWEHGHCCHAVNLYDEVLRVPLIVDYPERYQVPRRIAAQVSLIDLMPTVIGLAGLEDSKHREGLDLDNLILRGTLGPQAGRLLPQDMTLCEIALRTIPETKCLRTCKWKTILEPATGWLELYNLSDDPGETVNIGHQQPEIADSLLRLMERLPGVPLRGWRLAFTGSGKTSRFTVCVKSGNGAHFTVVQKLTSGKNLSIESRDEGDVFAVDAKPHTPCLVHFDVEPHDAQIGFDVSVTGSSAVRTAYAGSDGEKPLGKSFTLGITDALGVPAAFREARSSGDPGVFIWWLPGDEAAPVRPARKLTPVEKKNLKALGYIQ